MIKLLFTAVLSACLLIGCGETKEKPAELDQEDIQTQTVLAEIPEGVHMETEREIYDPSIKEIVCILTNDAEDALSFGSGFDLEWEKNGRWERVPSAWEPDEIGILYVLSPGETKAMRFHTDPYCESLKEGHYRLLKTAEIRNSDGTGTAAEAICAEFKLGDSPYSAETPYGIAALETLPEAYGADQGRRDGTATYTDRGLEGKLAITLFLQKVSMNIPCQLRFVQEFSEGTPMVTDTLYDGEKFCWKVRSGGGITQQYFSCLVTDGQSICLSDGVDWETMKTYAEHEHVYLIPEGTQGLEAEVELVACISEQQEKNSQARYRCWSSDGKYHADLTDDPSELVVAGPNRSESFSVTEKDGSPARISRLEWEPDGMLLVYSHNGARLFDPFSWKLY